MKYAMSQWFLCFYAYSCLVFNITVWYGHLRLANKNKLNRIIKVAGKMVGCKEKPLDDLYDTEESPVNHQR